MTLLADPPQQGESQSFSLSQVEDIYLRYIKGEPYTKIARFYDCLPSEAKAAVDQGRAIIEVEGLVRDSIAYRRYLLGEVINTELPKAREIEDLSRRVSAVATLINTAHGLVSGMDGIVRLFMDGGKPRGPSSFGGESGDPDPYEREDTGDIILMFPESGDPVMVRETPGHDDDE